MRKIKGYQRFHSREIFFLSRQVQDPYPSRMRWLLLLLALFATPLVAQQRQSVDYVLATTTTGLLIADWSQTLTIGRDPCYCEGNPVLGRHPTSGRVNAYFGLALATNLTALVLPPKPRRLWYGAVFLTELTVILTNIAHAR